MKRADLEIGGEDYYDRSSNWADASGYGTACKAVVVDLGFWGHSSDPWRRGEPIESTTAKVGYTCVLVDLHETRPDGTVRVTRLPVLPAHLRGPFESTAAQVAAAVQKRREAEQARADETGRARVEADAAVAWLARIGVEATVRHERGTRFVVAMVVEQAELLASLAERGTP